MTTHRLSKTSRLLARSGLCGALAGLAAALSAAPALALPSIADITPLVNNGGSLPFVSTNGSTMDVSLGAERTVIFWDSFNVSHGETVTFDFAHRDWIVMNRILARTPSTIDGAIYAVINANGGGGFMDGQAATIGGNVWFSAPSGMIIGPHAAINVGGFLATTAVLGTPPCQTEGCEGGGEDYFNFLDTTNRTFSFAGGDQNSVTVQGGASITAHGGTVALIAPRVITEAGSTVTGSTVLYGAADVYRVQFVREQKGDLDLVDFIVPKAGNGTSWATPLAISGDTHGENIYLAAVSKADVVNALISAPGLLDAQSASSDKGDVILVGGGGISNGAAYFVNGAGTTGVAMGSANAARNIMVKSRSRISGDHLDAGLDIDLDGMSGGGTLPDSVTFNILDAARDVTVTGDGADVEIGEAHAGRNIAIDVTDGKAQLGSADLRNDWPGAAAGAAPATAVAPTLTMTSTGKNAGVLLGYDFRTQNWTGALWGSGVVNLTSDDFVHVDLMGPATLNSVHAGGRVDILADSLSIHDITAGFGGAHVTSRGGDAIVANVTSDGDAIIHADGGRAVATNIDSGLNGSVGNVELVGSYGAHVARINASGSVDVHAYQGNAIAGHVTFGNGLIVSSYAGNASLSGATFDPTAQGEGGSNHIYVTALSEGGLYDASIGLDGDTVTGGAVITLQANRDAFANLTGDQTFDEVSAGRDALVTADSVSISTLNTGRIGSVTARTGDASVDEGFSLGDLTVQAPHGKARVGNASAGDDFILTGAQVELGGFEDDTGGSVLIRATDGGFTFLDPINSGESVTVDVSGALSLGSVHAATRSAHLRGASMIVSSVIAGANATFVTTSGNARIGTVQVSGNADFDIAGKAYLFDVRAANIDILAADLDIGSDGEGALDAGVIRIASRNGDMTLGGAQGNDAPSGPASSGFWLDNAEFALIHAHDRVDVYAGDPEGSARGNLTVLNLNIDPQLVSELNLYAGAGHMVSVSGAVVPDASGVALTIGSSDPSWRPDSVLITGSLGTATAQGSGFTAVKGFDSVSLNATNDILMGSQRFIALIQGTDAASIDQAHGQPAGAAATGDEIGHLFLVSGSLSMGASGKIVSQNTSGTTGSYFGIFLTGAGLDEAPVVKLAQTGTAATSGGSELVLGGPQVIDLFGAITDAGGSVISGKTVANSDQISVADSTFSNHYRINGCVIAQGACGDNPLPPQEGVQLETLTLPNPTLFSEPTLLTEEPDVSQDQDSDTLITGAGNEEIWRKTGVKP